MTLYKALKQLALDIDEFSIVFPEGIDMESGYYGCYGALLSEITEQAPDALTLTVTNICTRETEYCTEATIYTEYGNSYSYARAIERLLNGCGEDVLPPDVWTAIRWLGWDLKKEDDFTIGEMKKLAEICECDLVKVIEEIREEK